MGINAAIPANPGDGNIMGHAIGVVETALELCAESESPRSRLKDGLLHELFEAQVDLRPHALALVCDQRSFSYRELEERANQLARYLRAQGVTAGTFVGLYLDRSAEAIIAILACLKSGAAYVPVDPVFPVDRIRHIQEEAELLLVLTSSVLGEKAKELFTVPVVSLERCAAEIDLLPVDRLAADESGISPKDLAYVIYTSGTTGKPKGVMAVHRGAYRFAVAFNHVCGTNPTDRVYQGFSLAFDGSVEEIWMAFSNGSALVVGGREAPRFGSELGQYLADRGVTYFSTVPTLLSTLEPESIPSLKTLVVSGEVCSPELVSRWARLGLRMLNVYGPTEATVNTTAAECVPGQAVTIGKPLPGYDIYILNEKLEPVAYGEKGELYVGGETLAQGYLKRPDLTQDKFITVSGVGREPSTRLYRTGDLVRWNAQGELEFFGRIDNQVKIRGYRVELSEIEAVLLEQKTVRAASVKLVEKEGLQEIAAYVLTETSAGPFDRNEILSELEARLPSYMIPGYLEVLEEFPRLASGKVDRANLPAPVSPLVRMGTVVVKPENELEEKIERVWAKVFGLKEVSVESDFFLDLGGHSLVAAQMVTQLRSQLSQVVTVRDAYRYSTIRALAAHLSQLPEREAPRTASVLTPSTQDVFQSVPKKTRLATATLQALSIYALYGIASLPAGLLFLAGLEWVQGSLSLWRLVVAGFAIVLLSWPVFLALGIASKWILIGRYQAGKHPVGGFYFFRWWLAGRLQSMSGAGALVGTPLLPIYYRLMGAQVGHGCTLDTAHCSAWDLVKIGNDTSIGADTQLLGYRIENGMLMLGSVEIGSRCFVGIHSALGLDVRMGDDARLEDQSLLADRQIIGHGKSFRGSPASEALVVVPAIDGAKGLDLRDARMRRAMYGALHFVMGELMGVLLVLPTVPLLMLWTKAFFHWGIFAGVVSLIVSVPLGFALYCAYFVLIKRTFFSGIRPGVYRVDSPVYLKKWCSDGWMKLSKVILLPLYTTIYLPPWLRAMGAKIGKRAELSTVWQFAPELIDVGEESFFADGSIIGGKRFFRGVVEIAMNRIGRRSFVGNSAILPVGKSLGNGCLLGVQSIPPAEHVCTPDGSEWLGSPSFSLPHRKKVEGFENSVTFKPTLKLYVQRMVIDGLRILIPGYIGLSAAVMGVIALYEIHERAGRAGVFLLLPAVSLMLVLYAILLVVGLKKAVMGTFKPVIVPLWSMYVWLNEMVNGAYESVMAPAIAPFLGTPFAATFLRMIGCKIGRHSYIDTTLFSEFDLVEIGDFATLNVGAVIQNHLFEDRVMKSSYLKIGDGCSVGNLGVVLYDSVMEDGAVLGPLSLLMKGETLAAGSHSHGIPTVAVAAVEPEAPYVRESLEFHNVVGRSLRTQLGAQQRPAARDRGRPRGARVLEQMKEES